jgi:hypothetical protein
MNRAMSGLARMNQKELVDFLATLGVAAARTGTGTPEAVVTAPIGTLYINKSGGAATTLYVKTSGTGNTGWTAK